MLNFFDYAANNKHYRSFKVDDLLFVEYKCLIPGDRVAFWTDNNYFSFVLSGNPVYTVGDAEYEMQSGEAMFVRKGTYMARRNNPGDYCAVIIFVPDDFIRKVSEKYPGGQLRGDRDTTKGLNAIHRLALDETLQGYFQSVLSFFPRSEPPCPELLKIKFEELLLSIFTSSKNRLLSACLRRIAQGGKISVCDVMETSFMFPMTLEEYARLCARSLSAFKADFYAVYKTSPGRWLMKSRLQYAKILMETTEQSVGDVAFNSGFKNTAHFVRVFKDAYGVPPLQYRIRELRGTNDEVRMADVAAWN